MTYWLDLFTGTTWTEFRSAGGQITGFRERRRKTCDRIKQGDLFLCYLTGVGHWVGALKVIEASDDQSQIWKDDEFPVRLKVQTLIALDPEYGVPMKSLEGKVSFYKKPSNWPGYKGFVRGSPNEFKITGDGELIYKMLQEAHDNPVKKAVDLKKLARKPRYLKVRVKKGATEVQRIVSVPVIDEDDAPVAEPTLDNTTQHTEIQYLLLRLGAQIGCDVWVARNDRSKSFKGKALGELSGNVDKLPTHLGDVTTRTIELIDVLWLQKDTIVAAFEVEATTSVHSGLLRMNDLRALQPNLKLPLYLIAPDERRAKVRRELLRPTFALGDKPIAEGCGFISFEKLTALIEGLETFNLLTKLKPDFLEEQAEFFNEDDTEDEEP